MDSKSVVLKFVLCLFQRIFINNIQDFTGVSKINVKCKCGNGDLDETLNDISSIIMKKHN